MVLKSLTIAGDGAVHTIASFVPGYVAGNPLRAGKFVQASTPPTNASNVNVGGSEVSSTVGYPLPTGWEGQMLPPVAELSAFYDLAQIYVYVAAGDSLYVLYGG